MKSYIQIFCTVGKALLCYKNKIIFILKHTGQKFDTLVLGTFVDHSLAILWLIILRSVLFLFDSCPPA